MTAAAAPRICLIAAVAADGTIGDKNSIPWRIAGEQKYFRSVTTGHPIVMGRKTHESIGRPLPDRRNIVSRATRNTARQAAKPSRRSTMRWPLVARLRTFS